ncbi:MAG: endopeptidase La [Bacteroidaceae bacterium]|nr:endopeptidase La [Bacteroidaceae bacterium]
MAKKNRDMSENDPFSGPFEDPEHVVSFVAEIDSDAQDIFKPAPTKSELPLLPLRGIVLFPGVVMPVQIGREFSHNVVEEAHRKNSYFAVFSQKDPDVEEPKKDQLYSVGVVAKVLKVITLPDGSETAIIHGMHRVTLQSMHYGRKYPVAAIENMPEIPAVHNLEYMTMLDSCRERAIQFVKSTLDNNIPNELDFAIKNLNNPAIMINFIATNLPFEIKDKQDMLSLPMQERLVALLKILSKAQQLADLKNKINRITHHDLERQQKEYFLQQQIKNIQDELGDNSQEEEIEELKKKGRHKQWSSAIEEIFQKELAKLARTNTQSPDYMLQYNYLQTILNLPWNFCTQENWDMTTAQKALDQDHYGLEKVKERILEHLAVMKLRGDNKAPIICLYGPPGVGKTSLGKSIAHALGRKYVRISLGGLHDEAEIRGHRRTYIGAMAGRIISGLIKAGSSNPVFLLDEIDKVAQMTQNGDPSSALLEVLDPEQNNTFHDNYLDIDYDLSNVMFITTANSLSTIPSPLLDRMELIEVSGYITEEKLEIAKRHLLPRKIESNGLKRNNISMGKVVFEAIIENYTRESGVRQLEKVIDKIVRKTASKFASGHYLTCEKVTIQPKDLPDLLGKKTYSRDMYQNNKFAGVVTGLAWTAVGGEILFIETSLCRAKDGGKLTLTGNLGDVMKESAMLALEYSRAHASMLGLDPEVFTSFNIHIHVPEGAIPKDGPSAGVTMATSIASAFTQRKVKERLAMTGEITLRGKVLPVGGIREKILAAKRAGITEIILCKENRPDIEEIPAMYLEGLQFHYVDRISQVWDLALLNEKVASAIDITPNK